jgi:predicted acylesterase/phospholipase RssA
MMVEVSPGVWRDVTPGTQAMVLSGGGSYAAYEVGVMKALLGGHSRLTGFRPLAVDIFTGTSAGSINAAFMVSRRAEDDARALAELEGFWLGEMGSSRASCEPGAVRYRLDPRDLFNPACLTAEQPLRPLLRLAEDTAFFAQQFVQRTTNFFSTNAALERRVLELIDISAFISLGPFGRLLRENFCMEDIRTSPRRLRVAATSWTTGQLKLFANEDMTEEVGYDVLQASSAFPGTPPVEVEGELFVDGGYVMNTPLKPAIDAGADTLHIVYLDPDVSQLPVRRLYNAVDTLDKLYAIMMATIFNRDIEWAKDVNEGLRVLEEAPDPAPLADERLRNFLRTAGRIRDNLRAGTPYRKVTIHRYRPHEDIGGVVGILNFDRDHVAALIERGFRDAVTHDCIVNECALAGMPSAY